ncbi:hypothetical protein GX50_03079 [[Emmonsia] crescens]|uniref:Uncharacterized protein n=1 Tax=[Emmonsia] crescens TaxID=73230 RepID=A0A2B7ZJG8_9EURO|nr:hypothetical protein GX50_03079 [Emmonsia crescens]
MASQYSLVEYDSDEERERHADIPFANLISTAIFVAGLLNRAGISYGILGGFAVKLMGCSRNTCLRVCSNEIRQFEGRLDLEAADCFLETIGMHSFGR